MTRLSLKPFPQAASLPLVKWPRPVAAVGASLAVRLTITIFLSIVLTGCVDRDRVALDRYNQVQRARYQRYLQGDVSEAKQALNEMLAEARQSRGKLKYFYGTEWVACLTYGRLALIAEQEGEKENAQKFWNAAVEAQLQYQKDERMWARSNPNVKVPNQDSDVYERVTPDAIRKFIAGLEREKQIAWKRQANQIAQLVTTNRPGEYLLEPAWVGESKATVATGFFARSTYTPEQERSERELRFDWFDFQVSRVIGQGSSQTGIGHHYRASLPTDDQLTKARTVAALTNLLGYSQGIASPWDDGRATHSSSTWWFFQLRDETTIETLHVFCFTTRTNGHNETHVDSILIRRGTARPSR